MQRGLRIPPPLNEEGEEIDVVGWLDQVERPAEHTPTEIKSPVAHDLNGSGPVNGVPYPPSQS